MNSVRVILLCCLLVTFCDAFGSSLNIAQKTFDTLNTTVQATTEETFTQKTYLNFIIGVVSSNETLDALTLNTSNIEDSVIINQLKL